MNVASKIISLVFFPVLAIMDLSDQELCVALEKKTMFDVSDLFSSNWLPNLICVVVSFEEISL